MYANGQGVRQDDEQAAQWFRKAAEQGNAKAQFNLGLMYANGQGVRQDDAQAVQWFRKAAEQGFADAQYNLGVMYEMGEESVKMMHRQCIGFAMRQNKGMPKPNIIWA
ncbi:tetratricopeptide repeat protein [Neisseria lactamica]|uniref:tetratricopeptide repeat protein n=1 Tax=Neisseria lactamica TaxID=486 RepID=UPI003D80AF6E